MLVALVADNWVTVTSTTPAVPAGDVAVIRLALLYVTLVAGVVPNLTVAPETKLVPVITMLVPPAAGPNVGAMPVTVGASPVPVRGTLCVVVVAVSELSVAVSEPEMLPPTVGVKLMNSLHVPGASVPAPPPEATCGQVEVPLSVKFVEMLGLVPMLGAGKVRLALPTFCSSTVWGLSLLVAPATVVAKARLGGVASGIWFTVWLYESTTKTLPAPSTATLTGLSKPLPSVRMV